MFSILIVDDNHSDRVGIRGLIDWDALGVEVAGMAVDGLEGYDMAMRLRPDFVLTDVSMPVLDGIGMTEKIKAELPDTKFIFMSCFDDFEYLKGAISLEVYGYILKPIHLAELTAAISKVVQLKREELDKARDQLLLRKRVQESLPVLREQLFRDLLYGKLEDEEEIRGRLTDLGIDLTDKSCAVLFLQIDNFDLSYPELTGENRHLLIFGVQKCAEETILREFAGYATCQRHNSLVVVLILDAAGQAGAMDRIVDHSNRCKECVSSSLGVTLTIGISDPASGAASLPQAFESAQYAATSKFFSSGNRIIMASEVREPEQDFQYDIMDVKRRLEKIIESGETSDVHSFIEERYRSETYYPQTYIQSLTYSIVNVIQTCLLERSESYGSVFGDELSVWNKLQKFETVSDIKAWLIELIETVREFFAKKESGRYQKIVDDIKSIIERRYAEIENVNEIVSSLYISTSHANLIFKQHTGQTIFDYLIMKRMEVAKELLLDPYVKIYEIAERTGYKTPSYFASVFKEYTGLTSKQFRDKHSV